MIADTAHPIVSRVAEFVQNSVRPMASVLDRTSTYPADLIEEMRQIGLFGLGVPGEYRGIEASPRTTAAVFRELSRGWLSLSALLGSHVRVTRYLARFGTKDQQKAYLCDMASGDIIAAHGHSEPHCQDPMTFETAIHDIDGRLELSGAKEWVTNAAHADLIVVVARLRSARFPSVPLVIAMVRPNCQGVDIRPDPPRMGIKGVSICPVHFDNCQLEGDEAIIGGLSCDGRAMMEDSLTPQLVNMVARAVGSGAAMVNDGRNYVSCNPSLARQPVVRMRLASAATKQAAIEAALEGLLGRMEQGHDVALDAAMAKVFCTDTVQHIGQTIIQLYGGAGYIGSNGVERAFRDVAALLLSGKPRDVVLDIIGNTLLESATEDAHLVAAVERRP